MTLIVPALTWSAEALLVDSNWPTAIVPWLSSWAPSAREPPEPASEAIVAPATLTSVPAVTLSVADVAAPVLVSSIVALLVKPLATASEELYEPVPSTRRTEPATVVIAPGAAHTEIQFTTPELASAPVMSEAVISSVPPASITVFAVMLLLSIGTVVPAETVNIEGPATMLWLPVRRAMLLASGAVRLSVELSSSTVPAPPRVPPA